MPRRLGSTFGLCASAGALAALVVGITVPGSDAAPRRVVVAGRRLGGRADGCAQRRPAWPSSTRKKAKTKTPIKHVVVIFDENISYDHYFGTYPEATNKGGGTKFKAKKDTPKNDNLITSKKLKKNPNLYKPFRLCPDAAGDLRPEPRLHRRAEGHNLGAMDQFVQNVSVDTCGGLFGAPGLTMGYYDGNTVTGLWNYAQNFAMSDRSSAATSARRRPGAINLVSGNTHGFLEVDSVTGRAGPAQPTG